MNMPIFHFTLLLGALCVSAQQAPFASQPDAKWTVFHHPIKRVAVIGAGPAGLQAAAKLVEHNFTVRLFDRAPSPGGNWFYTDETPVREPYPYVLVCLSGDSVPTYLQ
jgi:NADPH-dependent 2,4-dienoyl-CoA reductase/sulfur reductase-like enzyme